MSPPAESPAGLSPFVCSSEGENGGLAVVFSFSWKILSKSTAIDCASARFPSAMSVLRCCLSHSPPPIAAPKRLPVARTEATATNRAVLTPIMAVLLVTAPAAPAAAPVVPAAVTATEQPAAALITVAP